MKFSWGAPRKEPPRDPLRGLRVLLLTAVALLLASIVYAYLILRDAHVL